MGRNFIDLTGQRFGRLTVIKEVGRSKNRNILWLCLCSCGNKKIVNSSYLITKRTKSCGCLNIEKIKLRSIKNEYAKTHGYYKTRTYSSWDHMIQRCTNKNNKFYKNYGGRGITVCKRWLNKKTGFINFLKDMGECPQGLTLDRIDNNKLINGYSPENCRWATRKQQQRNKRDNKFYCYKNKKQLLIDWAKKTNIDENTLYARIHKYGWTIEKALTTPVKNYRRKNNVRRN